ncbi:MAG: c-type cytochrome [Acidobacteriota bacterium]
MRVARPRLLALAMAAGAVAAPLAQDRPMPAESPGIKVLTGLTVPEFEREMQHFVQALGVSCLYCHAPRNFQSDDNPRKAVARRMIELTKAVNREYFPDYVPEPDASRLGRVTCQTCHNGTARPGVAAPPGPR